MNKPFAPSSTHQREPKQLKPPVSMSSFLGADEPNDTSVSIAEVRYVIMARRVREAMLGQELFADPAWDILLELYAAALAQRRLSTSELCVRSAAPATTALRWIDKLERAGLLTRVEDRLDGRRLWVELSAEGHSRIVSYFRAIGGIKCAA